MRGKQFVAVVVVVLDLEPVADGCLSLTKSDSVMHVWQSQASCHVQVLSLEKHLLTKFHITFRILVRRPSIFRKSIAVHFINSSRGCEDELNSGLFESYFPQIEQFRVSSSRLSQISKIDFVRFFVRILKT